MQPILNLINWLFQPAFYFAGSVIGFWAMIRYRETWTEPKNAMRLLVGATALLALAMLNRHFFSIATMPDNIPIFLMVYLVGFFLWLSLRQAVVNDRRLDAGQPPVEKETSDQKVYVWPDLVFIEFIATILGGVFLILWSLAFQAPLEQPANPTWSPNPAKAPWYFLGLQEMLVYYDPWLAGVVFPGAIVMGLIAIPFIDKNPKGSGYYTLKERRLAILPFLFGFLILWVSLVFMGTFLRGPNWNFFGPFEPWDPHKVVVLNNINLSELVWVKMLSTGLPKFWLLRELPGFLLIGLYLGALPPLLTLKVPYLQDLFKRLGFVRYGIFLNLALLMASLPLKMVLRWLFNLKYIVAIPEFFFNI